MGESSVVKPLHEINFLRPIVIFLIVVLHSFTIYTGGWPLPEGIERNYFYMGIAKMSHSCILETFTLISGYLLAYNVYERGKPLNLSSLLSKKFQRLLVPTIVFGILYKWLIDGMLPAFTGDYWNEVFSGVAHLWFLPMLFWCFVGTFFLLKWKGRERNKLLLLVLLCCAPVEGLPLQLGQTCYYWLFFYVGYLFRRNHEVLVMHCHFRHILNWTIVFLILFAGYTVLREILAHLQPASLWGEWRIASLTRAARMSAALPGVYVLLQYSLYFTSKHKLSQTWVHLNAYCFGVYLIHHFILPPLYYKTSLPIILGSYGLPWVGLLVSLSLSVGLTMFLVRTRIGKMLIG